MVIYDYYHAILNKDLAIHFVPLIAKNQ